MTIALIVFGSLLGLLSAFSGVLQLIDNPQPRKMKERIGLSDSQYKILALLKLAGAVGLLLGIWLPWLGALAAACLALYFIGGTIAEVRAKAGVKDTMPAVMFSVLALLTTWLELARF